MPAGSSTSSICGVCRGSRAHEYASGPVGPPPAPGAGRAGTGNGPQPGVGYHATSTDGLTFARQDDVRVDGPRAWLGNAQSDGDGIHFFGTGPQGVWTATSQDGQTWRVDAMPLPVPGADPGAVRLRDGTWLFAVTGPPRGR